ncbi:MAG: hypothetical protein HFG15_04790 [Bacilli bacterium]|nr:hypothetical protein [Bacilli bacterium]
MFSFFRKKEVTKVVEPEPPIPGTSTPFAYIQQQKTVHKLRELGEQKQANTPFENQHNLKQFEHAKNLREMQQQQNRNQLKGPNNPFHK